MTARRRERQRVIAAVNRRGLTVKQVAEMAELHPRTVQRFLTGKTFGLETLDILDAALELDAREDEVGIDDSPRPIPPKNAHGPVVGWEQAARELRISVSTLRRQRRRHGDETPTPWWGDVDELKRWYATMIAVER